MRIPRIFTSQPLVCDQAIELDAAASHYLSKVLRMQPDREVILFNGEGGEFAARITAVTKKSVTLLIGNFDSENRQSPLKLELAIGISRGERMDWVLQKATELGVTRITPLFTERTEVRLQGERLAKRMQHWQQITLSACEQCQRNIPPQLLPAQELASFLSQADTGLKLVLHHRSEQSLRQLPTPSAVTLLIGPEGGLSEREIDLAIQQSGYTPLTLGPRILRTETAPVAALTAVQMLWGDLG